jgi:hypothetical protein
LPYLYQEFKINTKANKIMEEEIYYFEDWILYMQSMSDYSLYELECFEEHYQNLLTFEENSDNFEQHLNN